ncbi:unnamed protein product, partial [Iphiclides podalirius]
MDIKKKNKFCLKRIPCLFKKYKLFLLLTMVFDHARNIYGQPVRPNIVLIIADDMGWDDVSFHGSDQILTPNIDMLAYTGVALERYYSHCICTPTRSALLTGKYSYVTGMQGYPLTNSEDRGLPVTEKIMPQYLKDLGYATHLVGKWHVGQSRTAFLPTMRGFDTHYGHRGGFIDYYEYTLQEADETGEEVSGLGLFRNMSAAWEDEGYVTDLYTKEAKAIITSHDELAPLFLTVAHNAPHSGNAAAVLQAPAEYVRSMRHIESPQRRIFAAMVKKLDESVGEIVNALLDKGILNNTIIAFISDNGGMTTGDSMNYASNWPLRGIKMTPFEGGNLRGIIGRNPPYLDSLQNSIVYKVLRRIDKPFNFKKMEIRDEIKVICNKVKSKENDLCYPQNNYWCLFNIKEDPCEVHDVSAKNPRIVHNMMTRLRKELERVKSRNKTIYRDPRSFPRLHNYSWDIWADNIAMA